MSKGSFSIENVPDLDFYNKPDRSHIQNSKGHKLKQAPRNNVSGNDERRAPMGILVHPDEAPQDGSLPVLPIKDGSHHGRIHIVQRGGNRRPVLHTKFVPNENIPPGKILKIGGDFKNPYLTRGVFENERMRVKAQYDDIEEGIRASDQLGKLFHYKNFLEINYFFLALNPEILGIPNRENDRYYLVMGLSDEEQQDTFGVRPSNIFVDDPFSIDPDAQAIRDLHPISFYRSVIQWARFEGLHVAFNPFPIRLIQPLSGPTKKHELYLQQIQHRLSDTQNSNLWYEQDAPSLIPSRFRFTTKDMGKYTIALVGLDPHINKYILSSLRLDDNNVDPSTIHRFPF